MPYLPNQNVYCKRDIFMHGNIRKKIPYSSQCLSHKLPINLSFFNGIVAFDKWLCKLPFDRYSFSASDIDSQKPFDEIPGRIIDTGYHVKSIKATETPVTKYVCSIISFNHRYLILRMNVLYGLSLSSLLIWVCRLDGFVLLPEIHDTVNIWRVHY